MYKSIIAPIVAFLAVVVQFVFGVEIPEDVVNNIIITSGNVVAVIIVLIGIFKNHKK